MEKPKRPNLRGSLISTPSGTGKQYRPEITHRKYTSFETSELPDQDEIEEIIEPNSEQPVKSRTEQFEELGAIVAQVEEQEARKQRSLDKLDKRHSAAADKRQEAASEAPRDAEILTKTPPPPPEPEPAGDPTEFYFDNQRVRRAIRGRASAEKRAALPKGVRPEGSEVKSGIEIDTNLPENEKRILRIAMNTRGSEAMQQTQARLRERNQTTAKKHEAALPFAEKMYQNEKTYFDALKKFQKERGFGSVFMDKLDRNENMDEYPAELKALKQTWIKSGAEYAAHMKEGAIKRHAEKNTGIERDKKGLSVLERYERRIVRKEIVLGSVEAEQRARAEGLESRDKKGIEKLFDKYSKLPKPARIFISSALVGAAGGVAMLGGSLVGTIAFAMAVPATITAAIAMFQKDPKARERLGNIAGGFAALTVGGLFGRAGEGAARGLHKLFGTRDKAKERLSKTDSLGDLSNEENLSKEFDERKNALRTEEKIAADARLARLAAGFLGGMEAGHLINQGVGAIGMPNFEFGHGVTDHLSIGDHIGHTNINDGDKLLGHFAEKLHHNDFPTGHEPAAVHKLNELLHVKGHHGLLRGEDHAAVKLGLERPDGSTVMQPGDTISLQHHQIVLDRPGHPDMHHVLIDSKGHLHPLNHHQWQRMPVHHETAATHPEQSAQPAPINPEVASSTSIPNPDAAAPEPSYLDVLKQAQMRVNLVNEHVPAQAAYDAGLKTPEQLATYNNYMAHYNELYPSADHAATVQASPTEVAHSPVQEASPSALRHFETTPSTTASPASAPATPEHSTEAVNSGIHVEQGSTDAFNAAKLAPAGTEVPYLSHTPNDAPPHWNTWVSDGNGHVHERLMVGEANGKPLPLSTESSSGSGNPIDDLVGLY